MKEAKTRVSALRHEHTRTKVYAVGLARKFALPKAPTSSSSVKVLKLISVNSASSSWLGLGLWSWLGLGLELGLGLGLRLGFELGQQLLGSAG